MRVYNGSKFNMDLPLAGTHRISISPNSVSGDILASETLLSQIATNYSPTEIALIVSGPFELIICSKFPVIHEYVVQDLDSAIARFNPKAAEPEVSSEVPTCNCESQCDSCTCSDTDNTCDMDVEVTEPEKKSKRSTRKTASSDSEDK